MSNSLGGDTQLVTVTVIRVLAAPVNEVDKSENLQNQL